MKAAQFSANNSKNTLGVFQNEKRKFLLSALGFFGGLPIFQFLISNKHRDSYYLYFLINLDLCQYMDESIFNTLHDRMLKQKSLLLYRCIPCQSKNKISWLFVFDSKDSRLKWSREALKTAVVSDKFSLNDPGFFQKEGSYKLNRSPWI